jgi:hypothetical protein
MMENGKWDAACGTGLSGLSRHSSNEGASKASANNIYSTVPSFQRNSYWQSQSASGGLTRSKGPGF